VSAPESLKSWRAEAKLSQGAAGKLIGVSAATWCDWEGGNKSPSVDRALDLERVTHGAVSVTAWAEWSREQREARAEARAADEPATGTHGGTP